TPMSEDQLRKIFAEGEPDWLEEHSRFGLDAQEIVELLETQTFFELLKLPYPTDRRGVIERLLQERLIDNLPGGYAIRRLGALLLATKLDQVGVKGYAAGFQGLVRFVMTQLPQNEVIEDAIRKEVKLIPEVVAR